VLREIYSPSCTLDPVSIEPELLRTCLNARKYLEVMNEEAFALAHEIIGGHERLTNAMPDDLELIRAFANDIASRR